MSGYFITFEGGDGSGKSSHARLIADRLAAEGYDVLCTREPGDTPSGKIIRDILIENTLEPRAELFLFLADRAQHVAESILPALEEGKIIICDRFSGSTIAYQIGGRTLPDTELILAMDAYARAGIQPDMTVYLDITPESAKERRAQDTTQQSDHFDQETIAFYERVRASFLEQAKQPEWITINTDGPKEENHEKIYQAIIDRLP